MEQSKAENFERIAAKRTRLAVDAARKLGNLSNTQYYEYDASDVERMFMEVEDELERSRARFEEAMSRGAR